MATVSTRTRAPSPLTLDVPINTAPSLVAFPDLQQWKQQQHEHDGHAHALRRSLLRPADGMWDVGCGMGWMGPVPDTTKSPSLTFKRDLGVRLAQVQSLGLGAIASSHLHFHSRFSRPACTLHMLGTCLGQPAPSIRSSTSMSLGPGTGPTGLSHACLHLARYHGSQPAHFQLFTLHGLP